MSAFERELTGARLADTHFGDTLPILAARELGDANRWPEIVWLNNLKPPYLTDNPQRAGNGVVLAGQQLLVPSPRNITSSEADPDLVFERDCALTKKQLTADGGDFAVVSGRANLKQQLVHRVQTQKGDLLRHPDYGCSVYRLVGTINGPAAGLLGAQYVKSALLSDFRVSSVTRAVATITGDQIAIDAEIVPIAGRPIEFQTGA